MIFFHGFEEAVGIWILDWKLELVLVCTKSERN